MFSSEGYNANNNKNKLHRIFSRIKKVIYVKSNIILRHVNKITFDFEIAKIVNNYFVNIGPKQVITSYTQSIYY